jgi:hypothetical protein
MREGERYKEMREGGSPWKRKRGREKHFYVQSLEGKVRARVCMVGS